MVVVKGVYILSVFLFKLFNNFAFVQQLVPCGSLIEYTGNHTYGGRHGLLPHGTRFLCLLLLRRELLWFTKAYLHQRPDTFSFVVSLSVLRKDFLRPESTRTSVPSHTCPSLSVPFGRNSLKKDARPEKGARGKPFQEQNTSRLHASTASVAKPVY